jgi:chromosome segregation ATPase
MSTHTPESAPPELEPYREQARELEEALAKVKGIQEQIAAVTLQRETVSKQRQGLLDSFEDEAAVGELSKLASRVEMHDAKLKTLADALAGAEADLKATLDTFGTSFKNLHSSLVAYLYQAALERILIRCTPRCGSAQRVRVAT